MNKLEKHLRNLNGKLVDVKTKINPKTGKKTRIIKIKRKKSKDRTSGSPYTAKSQVKGEQATPNIEDS